MRRDDATVKDAFKRHKPSFQASLATARNSAEIDGMIQKDKSTAIVTAVRGVHAKLDAMFSSALFKLMPDRQNGLIMHAMRLVNLKDELYYKEDEVGKLGLLPPFHHGLLHLCSSIPPHVSASLRGIEDVLDAVDRVMLEGLPYDFEVDVNLKNANPAHMLKH